jgi:hypothetical protein
VPETPQEQPARPDPPLADGATIEATLRATLEGPTDGAGQPREVAEMIASLHGELRRLAAGMFAGERAGHTLQPTAVVNEACARLLGGATIAPLERARGSSPSRRP